MLVSVPERNWAAPAPSDPPDDRNRGGYRPPEPSLHEAISRGARGGAAPSPERLFYRNANKHFSGMSDLI